MTPTKRLTSNARFTLVSRLQASHVDLRVGAVRTRSGRGAAVRTVVVRGTDLWHSGICLAVESFWAKVTDVLPSAGVKRACKEYEKEMSDAQDKENQSQLSKYYKSLH